MMQLRNKKEINRILGSFVLNIENKPLMLIPENLWSYIQKEKKGKTLILYKPNPTLLSFHLLQILHAEKSRENERERR